MNISTTTGTNANTFTVTLTVPRRPTYDEVYKLLEDTLENLRLMRQLDSLSKKKQTAVIVAGYELFDRWQSLRGLAQFGSEIKQRPRKSTT